MQTPRLLYWQWMLLWLVLFCGQLALALVTLSHTSDLATWLIVLGFCLPPLLMLVGTTMRSVRLRKVTQQIVAGDYWVHWTYTEPEWQRFRQSSFHWRWYKGVLAVLGIALAMSLFLGPLLWIEMAGVNLLDGLASLGVLLVIGLFYAFIDHLHWRYPGRHTRREIYITSEAVYYGLRDFSRIPYLHQMSIDAEKKGQHTLLLVCFKQGATGGRMAGAGGYSKQVRVPVPQGHEQEAQRLVHLFHQKPRSSMKVTDNDLSEPQPASNTAHAPAEEP